MVSCNKTLIFDSRARKKVYEKAQTLKLPDIINVIRKRLEGKEMLFLSILSGTEKIFVCPNIGLTNFSVVQLNLTVTKLDKKV